jgi:gliding motility-associated lipoprotein GldH
MRLVRIAALLATGIVIIAASCNSHRWYRETRRIPDGNWKTSEKVSFTVNIPDTSRLYSLFISIRNDVNYPFANIFLFLDTRFPDGRNTRDTVECQLADYDGRWLGSGTGSIRYSRFLFQKGVKFKQKGDYLFTFEQAMRTGELKGIRDLGFEIEL